MLITQNGLKLLEPTRFGNGAGSMIIFVSGTFGGASIQLQYRNGQGNMIPLEDGTLINNTQNVVEAGEMPIYIATTGADGTTAIDIETRGIV